MKNKIFFRYYKRKAGLLLFILTIRALSVSAQNTAPVASYPAVTGEARPGLTVWASYVYSDDDGDEQSGTTFQWYTASNKNGGGAAPISSATGSSYKIRDVDSGKYIGFAVTPGAGSGISPGDEVMTPVFVPVEENYPPEAVNVSISGSLDVNGVLTGSYLYSDYEGDLESGSEYIWMRSSSPSDGYENIPGASGISHRITMDEQGMYFRFSVTPRAAAGTSPGTKMTSLPYGRANSKPSASGVYISGKDSVNQTLEAFYSYYDADGDEEDKDSTIIRWYRDGVAVEGAEGRTYLLTTHDAGKMINLSVTPVSKKGYPDTGDTFFDPAAARGPVEDPSAPVPAALDPCIEGNRAEGQELTGKYTFSGGPYTEQGSRYLWFRNKTLVKAGTSIKYQLTGDDIDSLIIFAVIPGNNIGMTGDTAFSETLAIFNLPVDNYSIADQPRELEAFPAGGVFSGPGVVNGYFDPEVAGYENSPYTLNYLFTVSKTTTCIQRAWQEVKVKPIEVKFGGVKSVYCDNEGPATVYVMGVPPGASGKTFSISDPAAVLTQINDTAAIFYPDLMSSGDNKDFITFTYIDGITTVPIIKGLVIDHIGEVSIMNLKADSVFCTGSQPMELFTSHAGGTFTGPVFNGKLTPSMVTGYGDVTVTYTYTSPLGCSASDIAPIKVFASPDVAFEPLDYCILDSSDSTRMINNTISVDSVVQWRWEFSESGVTSYPEEREPAWLFRFGGDHKIVLTATTINGCSFTHDETFDFGVKPFADFTWRNECFHHPDSMILFFDATTTASEIVSRSWNFFDGDSLHTVRNPEYPQRNTGYLPVKYIVNTAYDGCGDTIFRKIYIRPTVTLADGDYNEDFESGSGSWTTDYSEVNTWLFGTPDRETIIGAASGDSAWFTGFDRLAYQVESSSVVSPCFDFTGIERPMIRMNMWKRFDRDRNGAALQYKLGDLSPWEYVGTLNDGINWYNSALIKGNPGGGQVGWTSFGSETGWSDARHRLDGLEGRRDVRFRIAYGSDGTSYNNDGMAFDDIWIGPRSRKVLLEHFTNSSAISDIEASQKVNEIAARNPGDVINIQYHTNFPGVDSFYVDNPGDASARILFYGLTRAPYSFLDGGNDPGNYARLFDYYLSAIDSNDVTRRSLINPLFGITLDPVVTGGVLTIDGEIKALADSTVTNMTLYLAVTEKESSEHPGTNGQTVFLNVFRKMIPDAAGIDLKKTWRKDETMSIPSHSWILENIANSSDIEIIAFLQNNITKDIYQAASVIKPDVTVGVERIMAPSLSFAIRPNPAVNKLTIDFREILSGDTDIRIFNMHGNIVSEYMAGSGSSLFTIDNLNLKQGIYMVRISRKGIDLGSGKLIVAGR